MAKAPLPWTLPGNFVVIVRGEDGYTLVLDDADGSTHKLGDDVQVMMNTLRRYKMDQQLFDLLDRAREFGMAQLIFADGRIVAIHGTAPKQLLDFSELDDDNFRKCSNLPSLSR